MPWDGIRNYQARNFMRNEMKAGDAVLFYHPNCPEPGAVGLAEVASEPCPDATAFDPHSEYFDPESDPAKPRWMLGDVRFVRKFPRTVTLRERCATPILAGRRILQRGNRLSITPVRKSEFDQIIRSAEKKGPPANGRALK